MRISAVLMIVVRFWLILYLILFLEVQSSRYAVYPFHKYYIFTSILYLLVAPFGTFTSNVTVVADTVFTA